MQHVRGSTRLGKASADHSDDLVKRGLAHEREMRIPTIVGLFEKRDCTRRARGRFRVERVVTDRRTLRWNVEPERRAVFAVHVDQVPQPPGDRREGFGVRPRQWPVREPRTVVTLVNRPATCRRFPQVLVVGQSLKSRSGPIPDLVGQVDQFGLAHWPILHRRALGPRSDRSTSAPSSYRW